MRYEDHVIIPFVHGIDLRGSGRDCHIHLLRIVCASAQNIHPYAGTDISGTKNLYAQALRWAKYVFEWCHRVLAPSDALSVTVEVISDLSIQLKYQY